MLRIECPWCGERDQSEFDFGGEAHVTRPTEPATADDGDWADYLFYRNNVCGEQSELWVHRWGCRQWFIAIRNTLTHEIHQVSKIGQPPAILQSPTVPAAGREETGSE